MIYETTKGIIFQRTANAVEEVLKWEKVLDIVVEQYRV